MGAVCHGNQHKCGGGGQFPNGRGQLSMDNSTSGVGGNFSLYGDSLLWKTADFQGGGAISHWMGAVCHGKNTNVCRLHVDEIVDLCKQFSWHHM